MTSTLQTMTLMKMLPIPSRTSMQIWRTFATLPKSKLHNQYCGSSSLQQWQYKSSRTFANYVNHSRCASAYCVTHSQKRTFLQSDLASSVQLPSKRSVATDPSSGYEHLLASRPVQLAQNVFEQCQDLTGLPWWGTIIVSTISLRLLLTLPLAVYSKHIAAKVEKLQPEIQMLAKQSFVRKYRHRALAEKWSAERVKKTMFYLSRPHAKALYIRDNCHPGKTFAILMTQLPLWICLSLSLKNMSGFNMGNRMLTDPNLLISDFTTGGMLWFHNLAVPDPYYIFPIMFGVLNLVNIEMGLLQKGPPMMRRQIMVMRVMQVVSIGILAIATFVPASMSMYWATSATYSTCQNILLRLPSTRSLLGMPRTMYDSDTPLRDMQEAFQEKYLKRHSSKDDEKGDESLTGQQENKIEHVTDKNK